MSSTGSDPAHGSVVEDGGPVVWFASQTLKIINTTVAVYASVPSINRKTKDKVFAAISQLPLDTQDDIRKAALALPRHFKKRLRAPDENLPRKRTKTAPATAPDPMDVEIPDSDDPEDWFGKMTLNRMVGVVYAHAQLRFEDKRTRKSLFDAIKTLPLDLQERIKLSAIEARQDGRVRSSYGAPASEEDDENLASEEETDDSFLQPPADDVLHSCIESYIDKTNNHAVSKQVCMICARLLFTTSLEEVDLQDLPNRKHLIPYHAHPAHELVGEYLIHSAVQDDARTFACSECLHNLRRNQRPPLALSNNMWIGRVPMQLEILEFAEKLLVSLYFPAVYVVKLYPKVRGDRDEDTLNRGMRGNVSSYRLDRDKIRDLACGKALPPAPAVLSAVVGVTFVGAKKRPLRILPGMLKVRRRRVREALLWLIKNNPLYADVEMSEERLEQYPEDGFPEEIVSTVRYEENEHLLSMEHDGYVPNYDDLQLPTGNNAGVTPIVGEDEEHESFEPDVIPMQAYGVVDTGATSIPDTDVMAHAMANTFQPKKQTDFAIRRGSAFINEYPRVDDNGQRTDGGTANPNHMLGAFPHLFPYGKGGFETERQRDVSYEEHARWALRYEDGRFRVDLYFVFQVYGVYQKRRTCRAAFLQTKTSSYNKHQAAFLQLTPKDLMKASGEETRRVPFTNPVVQSLRNQITAVRAKVPGTDESRQSIRSQAWGMTLLYNPATIWCTINLSDCGDPIAQVLAGQDINLDDFVKTAGPNSSERSKAIARDPFAAAEFFHLVINLILRELFGISAQAGRISRKEGICGMVRGYIGTVEAQGRGTLHLHILFWLMGAPTAQLMAELLRSDSFRDKVAAFIKSTIRAHIEGLTAPALEEMPIVHNVSYARPVDPRKPGYEQSMARVEADVARTVQYHACDPYRCLKNRNGRLVCKRRAPFPLSSREWVTPSGEWGPRRLHAKMNNWNPTILQAVRCNHDLKLITHGHETKDILWYITLYIAKKQTQTSNASALLAKNLAYNRKTNAHIDNCMDLNKKMLTQCANTLSREQELSGPEVISHLMGWGDRFISHIFVTIFWDEVARALRRAYPRLWQKSSDAPNTSGAAQLSGTTPRVPMNSTAVSDTDTPMPAPDIQNGAASDAFVDGRVVAQSQNASEAPIDSTTVNDTPLPAPAERDTVARIEFVDGAVVLKDQLKEYADRGHELDDMNFLDYFLHTYDGKDLPVTDGVGFKPRSERIPYLEGSGRKNCRIVRQDGHETVPRFVGSWFPRDTPATREYYCANMLALLCPWRGLDDLKPMEDESFSQVFERFLECADEKVKRIIANAKYFHECSDSARVRKPSDMSPASGAVLEVEDRQPDDFTFDFTLPELTLDDIAIARASRWDPQDVVYGQGAMAAARNVGLFCDDEVDGCQLPDVRRALVDDLVKFRAWNETLVKMTRAGLVTTDNRPVLPMPDPNVFAAPKPVEPVEPGVLFLPPPEGRKRNASQQATLDSLNVEQRRAHDIIEEHLLRTLAGQNPPQLLMIIRGEGGTGKTVLLNAISETFKLHSDEPLLAKTGTTGVSASLVAGETLHSWAGVPVTPHKGLDWVHTPAKKTAEKRAQNISKAKYLSIDEMSMLTKSVFAIVSEIISSVKAKGSDPSEGRASQPFGGLNLILTGDPHQFPPVAAPKGALYCPDHGTNAERDQLGRNLYLQFNTVVTLKQQMRVTDPRWMELLVRLRTGDCTEEDINILDSLLVSNKACEVPNWTEPGWAVPTLITARHAARMEWNLASLKKHCSDSGQRMYIAQAHDVRTDGNELTLQDLVVIAGCKAQVTGKLTDRVELAVGMRAMIVLNVATESDLANGTRGTIVDMELDPREPEGGNTDPDTGARLLSFLPAVVYFKPDHCTAPAFDGLSQGILPLAPSTRTFTIRRKDGFAVQMTRRQYAITPAYAFTDYKSQGQTMNNVLIDLQQPSTKSLTPFSAYVALSRGRGRSSIRLLRGYDKKLFTTHPSEHLAVEDERLDYLSKKTAEQFKAASEAAVGAAHVPLAN